MIKYIIFFLILTTSTLVYAKNESAILLEGVFGVYKLKLINYLE